MQGTQQTTGENKKIKYYPVAVSNPIAKILLRPYVTMSNIFLCDKFSC